MGDGVKRRWPLLIHRAIARAMSANQSFLRRYLWLVNLVAARHAFFAKRADDLAGLPSPRPMAILIEAPVRFIYFTPGAEDELHSASRTAFRNWEPKSRAAFAALAMHSTTVLDIGAYSGVYGLTAALANPSVSVLMFEPNPQMTPQIRKSILLNHVQNRVTLHEFALSDFNGAAPLFLSEETGTAGIASLRFEPHSHPINSNSSNLFVTREVQVPVRTIDSLKLANVDLIKIDAEGSEPTAFAGAMTTLNRCQPIIFSEALTKDALEAQRAQLESSGYLPPIPVAPDGRFGDDCNYLWVTQSDLAHVSGILRAIGIGAL